VDDRLGNLSRLDAILERLVGIVAERGRLAARDHRGDGDQAAVAAIQARPRPDLAVEPLLRVFFQRRRDRAHLIGRKASASDIGLLGVGGRGCHDKNSCDQGDDGLHGVRSFENAPVAAGTANGVR
jgi:hypothetical protein